MTVHRNVLHLPRDRRTYTVVIIGGTKCGEWGRYSTEAQARQIAATLRKHGFDARVLDGRGDVVTPEAQQ